MATACGSTDRVVAVYARDASPPDVVRDTPAVDADDFCAPARGGAACRGAVVATSFRYALCVCDAQAISGSLVTDSFDSARGPYGVPARLAGAVGVNGSLTASGRLDVGGALLVGSAQGVTALDALRVRGLARIGGGLMGSSNATFEDVSLRGDVEARSLRVLGTLTLPAGRSVRTVEAREVARMATADVAVPPPCDCAAAARVPVEALVAARRTDNDNGAAGLTDDALTRVDRAARLALPCGRFYLRGVSGASPLTLIVAGRVALYVEGDVSVDALRVELTAGAEVDVFITGNLNVTRTLAFGDPATPARARMYVGGGGGLSLGGDGVFGGNLYAPGVELRLAGDVTVYGSVLARVVTASGNLAVHFDQAVLDPGAGCEAPSAPTCASCRDCPLRACVDGRCAQCRSDADCCAPLRCAGGRCQPEPP